MENEATTILPSSRAASTFQKGKAWDLMMDVQRLPQYNAQTTPNGIVNLSGALNGLMEDFMDKYVQNVREKLDIRQVLDYGSIAGTEDLLDHLSAFFNRFFSPACPVTPGEIIVTNGVTSLIDMIGWNICEHGEAILYPVPNFYMLDFNLTARDGIVTIPVPCSHISDPFSAESATELVDAFQTALLNARERGIVTKAVFLCNPANPEGRSYTSGALEKIAQFCGRNKLHLIADEIYALSSFHQASDSQSEGFSSVLNIPDSPENSIFKENIHLLYGVSKDFNLGGLRMGFLVTRNKALWATINRVAWFTWITSFSVELLTDLFADLDRIQQYITIYQGRLADAYLRTSSQLKSFNIPFKNPNSGLFFLLDLSQWLVYFRDDGQSVGKGVTLSEVDDNDSRELQLCRWLIRRGIFLNAAEFAQADVPGQFRLVFTAQQDVVDIGVRRLGAALTELEQQQQVSLNNDYMTADGDGSTLVATLSHINPKEGALENTGWSKAGLSRLLRSLRCY